MHSTRIPLGCWQTSADARVPTQDSAVAQAILGNLAMPVSVVASANGLAITSGGIATFGGSVSRSLPLLAFLPPLQPDQLGDFNFRTSHGLKYAYMTGAMANGIGSCDIVESMCKNGMLGSFGAAGLSLERITHAIDRLQASLGDRPFCINLIHSPNEPAHEAAVADLLLRRGVKLVEASAYLDLTPAIVRYRVSGIYHTHDGNVTTENRVIAKVSRTEVATKFLSPPPERILQQLVADGLITEAQAHLAASIPMCDDLIAEADSGGHTDNRPAITLLPTMIELRNRLHQKFNYASAPRVGLAGGLATPASVAGAFALGAAFVVTGSVNQACLESGSSDEVRKMLAEAGQADVMMAPAADMFEMGVKVQVLKRGTMFPMRAAKLFEQYRQYPSWEAIPENDRSFIEKSLLRTSFEEIWGQTREFFSRRDPTQLPKAEQDPKHKMALVFRWYLGLSSRWANTGEASRQVDFQVWCGPAMGAFNEWAKGSFLEAPGQRRVSVVAKNLLYGACLHLRRTSLLQQGVQVPDDWFRSRPLTEAELDKLM